MLVDKKNGNIISGNSDSPAKEPPVQHESHKGKMPNDLRRNAIMEVMEAIKAILRKVTWEYGNDDSPYIFKTVARDDGQYSRIVTKNVNKEYTLGFPAALYHLINWHYLTTAKRINEGRAELRIKFILNRLNPQDDYHDMDVEYVAGRINETIQENIKNYPCLQERCQLMYVDPMESFDNGLQPCWMTYEIWFKEDNVWYERNMIQKYVVMPPFTNHSDQDTTIEDINPQNHENADHPQQWEEGADYTKYIPSQVEPEED